MQSGGSFHSQLMSVMEVLAKAAVEEINRRVDDSCAVLRLEISRSQRDIDALKRKCEVMEAELRRSKIRARRRVSSPSAADRLSAAGSTSPDRGGGSAGAWAVGTDAPERSPGPPAQIASERDTVHIKEESKEEDDWENVQPEEGPAAAQPPGLEASSLGQAGIFAGRSPSTQSPSSHGRTLTALQVELPMKHEEKSASAGGPVAEGVGVQLWTRDPGGDAREGGVRYPGEERHRRGLAPMGPVPAVTTPQISSTGTSCSATASSARVKKQARIRRTPASHARPCGPMEQRYGNNRDLTPPNQTPGFGMGGHSRQGFGAGGGGGGSIRRRRPPPRSGVGEKRFNCTYCERIFMRFSQLKEHLRRHTGERPFSCPQCGRSFTKQCNLIRHAVVHSGEKPHECVQCGKCFTQRSSMTSHQKAAH